MKNRHKFILSLAALLMLCILVWWLKSAAPSRTLPAQTNSTPPETFASETAAKRLQPTTAAVTPTPSNAGSSGNAAPQRKFSEMGLSEGGAVMGEIEKKDLATIFQILLDSKRVEHDSMKQMAVRTTLSDALRDRKPNPEFLKKLQEFIESDKPSEFEREMVLGVLSYAATKETGELLLHEAITLKDKEVRDSAIAKVGSLGSRAQNEDLSPALNRAWSETNDPLMIKATAMSMGRIGSATSVELLLPAALALDGQDDERRNAAWNGLREVYTGNAVPPLVAVLEKNPVGSRANTLAFDTLSQIVGKEAPQAVMKWLQTTDSSAAPLAKAWAVHVRHDSQLEAAQAALDPSVPFRSEENRKALREGLDAYRAAHKQFEK